jgi:hypothetical protein
MDTNQSEVRWQDWVNLAIGIWLFISPMVMIFPAGVPAISWNAYVIGAAIVIFSAYAVYLPRAWEEALNALFGIWLIIAPWILGFSDQKEAMMHSLIVGAVVVILALWAMTVDKGFETWRHKH